MNYQRFNYQRKKGEQAYIELQQHDDLQEQKDKQLQAKFTRDWTNKEDLVFEKLFTKLPKQDMWINYPEQIQYLQICNLALLDEVKRMEQEIREVKRPSQMELFTNPDDPFFLITNSLSHHQPTHMFNFE